MSTAVELREGDVVNYQGVHKAIYRLDCWYDEGIPKVTIRWEGGGEAVSTATPDGESWVWSDDYEVVGHTPPQ